MKSALLQRIQTNVEKLKEQPAKPTSKEQQQSFGLLKSSSDMPEAPKKGKSNKK